MPNASMSLCGNPCGNEDETIGLPLQAEQDAPPIWLWMKTCSTSETESLLVLIF